MIFNPEDGIMVPLVTPFLGRGSTTARIDREAVGRIVKINLDAGINAFLVAGTTGEEPWLTLEQKFEMLDATTQAVKDSGKQAHVSFHASRLDMAETIESVKYGNGKANSITLAPTYFVCDPNDFSREMGVLVRQTSLPLFLYNLPFHIVNALQVYNHGWGTFAPHDYQEAIKHFPQIAGIKDSQNTPSLRLEYGQISAREGRIHFIGDESFLGTYPFIVTSFANFDPELVAYAQSSLLEGDHEQAAVASQRIVELGRQIYIPGKGIAGLKYALAQRGDCSDETVDVIPRLTKSDKRTIDECLRKL